MKRYELLHTVDQEANISKEKNSKALDAIRQSIESFLVQGGNVTIGGFGTFKATKRKEKRPQSPYARSYCNPIKGCACI